jgi:hypothetical protein
MATKKKLPKIKSRPKPQAPAAGYLARELADIICKLGCASSNFDNETF